MKIFKAPNRKQTREIEEKIAQREGGINLYFGEDAELSTYTKMTDRILFEWLKELVDLMSDEMYNLTVKQQKIFSKHIIRCAREILYNKIKTFNNLVDMGKLQCMGAAATALAVKTIRQYDHTSTDDILAVFNYYAAGVCNISQLGAMERDLIKTEGWIPCKTVMERMPIHEEEVEFEEGLLQTLLKNFVSPFMLFPETPVLQDSYFQ